MKVTQSWIHTGALLWVAAVLGGCLTARRGEPVAPPLALSDPTLVRGREVFYQQCHYCHPHGGTGLGPAINNKPLPGFLMKVQVRHGLGVMPSFKADEISSADLDALVAYLKVLRGNKPAPDAVAK